MNFRRQNNELLVVIMATLKDFDDDEKSCLIECVHALIDTTVLSIKDICDETGLSRNSVRG